MKNQALFSSKDKSKKLKCRLLQFLFGALKINGISNFICQSCIDLEMNKSVTIFKFDKLICLKAGVLS